MINEEIIQKMTLKSTLDFLWIHFVAALIGCCFILQTHSPAYIKFIAWIGIIGAIFAMIKGTFARLDLDQEGFTYRLFSYKKFTCWADVEDIHIIKVQNRITYTRQIVRSYSDKKRTELKMELLRYRGWAFNGLLWGYWVDYDTKNVVDMMTSFREAYRKSHNEPLPVYPVWDERSHQHSQSA